MTLGSLEKASSGFLAAVIASFVVVGAGPALGQGEATLQIDLAADEEYRRCLGEIGAGRDLVAQACFQGVIERAPESTAALKAQSALKTMKAREALERSSLLPPDIWPFKPGRLELSVMSGAFGIFTGGAVTAMFTTQQFALIPPFLPIISGAGGAMAVALGGGFALGSFFVGELLDLKGGPSRLLGSGMGWGTGFGLALAPWMFALTGANWPPGSIVPDFATLDLARGVPLSMGVMLATGYAGVAISGLAAYVFDAGWLGLSISQGQVSTLNTGIWSGLALGMLTSPLLGLAGFGAPGWLGLAWITGGAAGLVWGSAMAFVLDLDVWEVLLIDAAGVAALVGVGGALGAAGFVAGNMLWLNAILAGVTGIATLAAMGAATAGMAFWRIKRGERVSRLGFLPVEDLFQPPELEVVYDKKGRPTPIAGIVSLRF